jgi:hypothetical protein
MPADELISTPCSPHTQPHPFANLTLFFALITPLTLFPVSSLHHFKFIRLDFKNKHQNAKTNNQRLSLLGLSIISTCRNTSHTTPTLRTRTTYQISSNSKPGLTQKTQNSTERYFAKHIRIRTSTAPRSAQSGL